MPYLFLGGSRHQAYVEEVGFLNGGRPNGRPDHNGIPSGPFNTKLLIVSVKF